ncbi:MFS transporter [Fluviispira vulneris]|uniref:MFS transporter n=1 Tax=Fluviispira vulneris TaxID=2763012 RepID=UPI0016488F59|nr:MFS transporter [Fluviispira vulneris]
MTKNHDLNKQEIPKSVQYLLSFCFLIPCIGLDFFLPISHIIFKDYLIETNVSSFTSFYLIGLGVGAISAAPIGDRGNPIKVIFICSFILIILFNLNYIFYKNIHLSIILRFLEGGFGGGIIAMVPTLLLVSQQKEDGLKSIFILNIITSLSLILTPLFSKLFITIFSWSYIFIFLSIIQFFIFIFLFLFRKDLFKLNRKNYDLNKKISLKELFLKEHVFLVIVAASLYAPLVISNTFSTFILKNEGKVEFAYLWQVLIVAAFMAGSFYGKLISKRKNSESIYTTGNRFIKLGLCFLGIFYLLSYLYTMPIFTIFFAYICLQFGSALTISYVIYYRMSRFPSSSYSSYSFGLVFRYFLIALIVEMITVSTNKFLSVNIYIFILMIISLIPVHIIKYETKKVV